MAKLLARSPDNQTISKNGQTNVADYIIPTVTTVHHLIIFLKYLQTLLGCLDHPTTSKSACFQCIVIIFITTTQSPSKMSPYAHFQRWLFVSSSPPPNHPWKWANALIFKGGWVDNQIRHEMKVSAPPISVWWGVHTSLLCQNPFWHDNIRLLTSLPHWKQGSHISSTSKTHLSMTRSLPHPDMHISRVFLVNLSIFM